jgi:hypothetical protein
VLTLAKPRETYSQAEEVPEPRSESGRILLCIFEMLKRAGIPYCVLHGYEDFSADIKSDVDCIIGANTPAHDLLVLFRRNRHRIGAEVVRCMGHFFVLAGRNADGSPCFLALDFATNCDVNDLPLYDGGEILTTRRRYAQCYIPTANIEFGVSMARSIAKQTLDDERAHGARPLSGVHALQSRCRPAGHAGREWQQGRSCDAGKTLSRASQLDGPLQWFVPAALLRGWTRELRVADGIALNLRDP